MPPLRLEYLPNRNPRSFTKIHKVSQSFQKVYKNSERVPKFQKFCDIFPHGYPYGDPLGLNFDILDIQTGIFGPEIHIDIQDIPIRGAYPSPWKVSTSHSFV
jgi:ribosomal protein S8